MSDSRTSKDWSSVFETESRRRSDLTLTYATVGDLDLILDAYLPPSTKGPASKDPRPTFVFFHGGGVLMGSTKSWLPNWLIDIAHSRGWIFLSAEYRLLMPATGHAVIEDVKSLFSFIATSLNSHLASRDLQVDPSRLLVGGSSAGGYVARLAALHAEPKPKAMLSIYGMGGDLLSPFYTAGKTEPFYLGEPILDASEYQDLTDLETIKSKKQFCSIPVVFDSDPATEEGRRIRATRIQLQTGTFLNVLTGIKSFSSELSEAGFDPSTVPESVRPMFPELFLGSFPPTFLAHGSADTIVDPQESIKTHEGLKKLGIDTELAIWEGGLHLFEDQLPSAMGKLFGGLGDWLEKYVR